MTVTFFCLFVYLIFFPLLNLGYAIGVSFTMYGTANHNALVELLNGGSNKRTIVLVSVYLKTRHVEWSRVFVPLPTKCGNKGKP